MSRRVSIVIPTLNEATTILDCLAALRSQGAEETIVADGGSTDATATLARTAGVTVVESPRGRGVQQNRGAAVASGDILLFLHADCRLDPGAIGELRRFLARNPRCPAGCFRMRVEGPEVAFRFVDAAAHLRAGVLGVPYGDQAMFVARWAFDQVAGFPERPLMEDVLIALRLRRLGRMALLRPAVNVSPRRWRRTGIARQSFRNWTLTAAAAAGVPVERLARHYPAVR